MIDDLITSSLSKIGSIDPSPFFVLSLFPYLIFLYWAGKSTHIPKLALWGFRLTLLFVFMTILFAIVAMRFYEGQLTDVDPLHGAAESFLTISDALVVLGFLRLGQSKILTKPKVNNS